MLKSYATIMSNKYVDKYIESHWDNSQEQIYW